MNPLDDGKENNVSHALSFGIFFKMRVEGLEETRIAYTKAKAEERAKEEGDQIDLKLTFPDGSSGSHRCV